MPFVITDAPGNRFAAASSNTMVDPATIGLFPPACDISTTACPPGPTSSRSTSDGRVVWKKSCNVTVTRTTCPVTPATEITDGYGDDARVAGTARSFVLKIVIVPAFVNAKIVVG